MKTCSDFDIEKCIACSEVDIFKSCLKQGRGDKDFISKEIERRVELCTINVMRSFIEISILKKTFLKMKKAGLLNYLIVAIEEYFPEYINDLEKLKLLL